MCLNKQNCTSILHIHVIKQNFGSNIDIFLYKLLSLTSSIFAFASQELILDTLHYCMTIETQSALESGAMESFTKLLSHKSATIRGKAARDIMDLR